MIASTPRKQFAAVTAASILIACNATSFPISLNAIVKKLDIACMTYRSLAEKNGKRVADVESIMDSYDGAAFRLNSKYYIAYNSDMFIERIRFTIAHEIGHIVLGHLFGTHGFRLVRSSISERSFFAYEEEADTFARNLLAPSAAHDLRSNKSLYATQSFFSISKSCASMRCVFSGRDSEYLRDMGVYQAQADQFADYIRANPEGAPQSNKCSGSRRGCGVYLNSEYMRCPYCGSLTLASLRGKVYALDDAAKPRTNILTPYFADLPDFNIEGAI